MFFNEIQPKETVSIKKDLIVPPNDFRKRFVNFSCFCIKVYLEILKTKSLGFFYIVLTSVKFAFQKFSKLLY